MSFYYFYKTIAYKKTGNSRLKDKGKIVAATRLIKLSTKIFPPEAFGI
jgi:hypothetical protein